MEYLKENDPSLSESLEIAAELGYDFKNLNSEILASLLASRKEEEIINVAVKKLAEFIENEF